MHEHKRSLKVNLKDLAAAFDSGFDEIWQYLDLETGEVVMVTGDSRRQLEALLEATDAESSEAVHKAIQNEDVPDWENDALYTAALVESGYGSRFVEIPKVDSWEGYEDMEAFIETVSRGEGMTFHIGQDIFDDYGNYLEEQGDAYRDQLLALFDASPEGQALVTGGIELRWTSLLLDYAFRYLGAGVPEIDDDALEEILFQLIPEKVVAEPSSAPAIVTESRAFWNFVKREFGLPNADSCLEFLHRPGIIEDLRASLDDPAQYGMSKSIVMEGMRRGFDMSTQEGLEKWIMIHNQEALARMQNAPTSQPWLPSLPLSQDLDTLAVSRGHAKTDKKKKSKRKMEKASRRKNRGK